VADGDIEINSETARLVTALAKYQPETAKILKQELSKYGLHAKRVIGANTPTRTGFAKSRWSKGMTVSKDEVRVYVSIAWPSGVPRYPFMLEHGRHGGVSKKTGRSVTYMEPRKYLARSRAELVPIGERLMQEIHDKAVDAFDA
jgi:hypothetical protein